MRNSFNTLFLLGALFVSSVVGYHSVLGFVSSFGTTYVFAVSLEIAKLLVVSFVSRYSAHLAPLHKVFGWFFVVCLISISSFGIFGYLTHDMTERVSQLESLTSSMKSTETEVFALNKQITELERLRNTELERQMAVSTKTDLAKTRERVFSQFGSQVDTLTAKRNTASEHLKALQQKVAENSRHSSTVANVAQVFNVSVNTALLAVAFLVTAVFDPVAVYLFTLYGKSVTIKAKDQEDLALEQYVKYTASCDEKFHAFVTQTETALKQQEQTIAEALRLAKEAHVESFTHRDEINAIHKSIN